MRESEREREREILTTFVWLLVNLGKHTDKTEKKNNWVIEKTPLGGSLETVKTGCTPADSHCDVGSVQVKKKGCTPCPQSPGGRWGYHI